MLQDLVNNLTPIAVLLMLLLLMWGALTALLGWRYALW